MSDQTSIEWTAGPDGKPGASWNPIRARRLTTPGADGGLGWHCEIVSPGCEHCYAQAINKRLGTGLPYRVPYREEAEIILDEKALNAPLHWRKPRRIFLCSMSDLFGEWVPDETIDQVFAIAALCPQHTFIVLTKRAARMRDYLSGSGLAQERRDHIAVEALDLRDSLGERRGLLWFSDKQCLIQHDRWPLPNVWLGVSVEDQRRADERIPHLLASPAAVRFVSYEPALAPVDFTRLSVSGDLLDALRGYGEDPGSQTGALNWIIVGGESGPGARPFNIEWGRSVVEQCKAAGVACFVKQIGSLPLAYGYPLERGQHSDRKGGDPAEWPDDMRVREFPRT
jgi:protein gp37